MRDNEEIPMSQPETALCDPKAEQANIRFASNSQAEPGVTITRSTARLALLQAEVAVYEIDTKINEAKNRRDELTRQLGALQLDIDAMLRVRDDRTRLVRDLRAEREWRPIETFPRDGKEYLVCSHHFLDGKQMIVAWRGSYDLYPLATADGIPYAVGAFAYWQPLPVPPSAP